MLFTDFFQFHFAKLLLLSLPAQLTSLSSPKENFDRLSSQVYFPIQNSSSKLHTPQPPDTPSRPFLASSANNLTPFQDYSPGLCQKRLPQPFQFSFSSFLSPSTMLGEFLVVYLHFQKDSRWLKTWNLLLECNVWTLYTVFQPSSVTQPTPENLHRQAFYSLKSQPILPLVSSVRQSLLTLSSTYLTLHWNRLFTHSPPLALHSLARRRLWTPQKQSSVLFTSPQHQAWQRRGHQ